MKKIFLIAQREFLDIVKTRIFFISLFLTPIILIAFSLLPMLASQENTETSYLISVSSSDDFLLERLVQNTEMVNFQKRYQVFSILNLHVSDKKSNIIFVNLKDINNVQVDYPFTLSDEYKALLRGIINKSLMELKLKDSGVNLGFINKIGLDNQIIFKLFSDKKQDIIQLLFSALSLVSLFILIVTYTGGMYVRSFFEEKSSNLLEFLLSACKPSEILLGKILGLVLTGIFQILIWFIFLSTTDHLNITNLNLNLFALIDYFVIGYIFYTTIFVGIGSLVKTEQQAQQATVYISLLLFLPLMILLMTITKNDFNLVDYFCYNPFTAPTAMILKINSGIYTLRQIIATNIVMIASIAAMFGLLQKFFALKVFKRL